MKKQRFLTVSLNGTVIYILVLIFLSIIYSKLVILVPKFIEYALDGVVFQNEHLIPDSISYFFYSDSWQSKIVVLTICLVIVNLCIFLVSYIKSKFVTYFNLKVNENIKYTVLQHVPNISYLNYSKINKADITQRVNSDAEIYADFFKSIIDLFLDTIFIIGFSIQEIFKLSSIVGIFIIVVCVLITILSLWYFKVSRLFVEDVFDQNKKVIQKINNALVHSKMIKAFNRQEEEKSLFIKENDQYKKSEVKLAKIKVIYRITSHTIRNFKAPFILLVGSIMVVNGDLTLVGIALLLTYSTTITSYVYSVVEKLQNLNDFLVAYKRLNQLLQVKEEDYSKEIVTLEGNIKFENVSIMIDDKVYLKNLNFEIKKGDNVSIVGDNGSGKTLLVKTLLGFYPYQGNIYIGNTNLKDINQKSIRKYIGIVLQDSYIFNTSIKNNITMINRKLNQKEMKQLCKMACLDQDINSLKEKYDYVLESNGSNLSGGQKQRLSIVRTLANKESEFVIFDDSLSKLDSSTKLEILNHLIEMSKGAIIVSHDRSIIERCNHVLFINHGSGIYDTHSNLLRNPNYSKLIDVDDDMILEGD